MGTHHNDYQFDVEHVSFEDSAAGKQLAELHELRKQLEQYRAEQASCQSAAEHREKVAERKGFWRGVASGFVTTVVGGLIVYYWPGFIAWLFSFGQ